LQTFLSKKKLSIKEAVVGPDEAGERIWLIPTKVFTPLIAACADWL
jgi:hypothetical protein